MSIPPYQLTILKKKMFECFQIDFIETIYFQKNSWETIDFYTEL